MDKKGASTPPGAGSAGCWWPSAALFCKLSAEGCCPAQDYAPCSLDRLVEIQWPGALKKEIPAPELLVGSDEISVSTTS